MPGCSLLVCILSEGSFKLTPRLGQPPVANKFDDSLAVEYTQLANKWLEDNGDSATEEDVKDWNAKQLSNFSFLEYILNSIVGFLGILVTAKDKLFTASQLHKLGEVYKVGLVVYKQN